MADPLLKQIAMLRACRDFVKLQPRMGYSPANGHQGKFKQMNCICVYQQANPVTQWMAKVPDVSHRYASHVKWTANQRYATDQALALP